MMTIFRNSIRNVTKFYCRCQKYIRWYLGKSVQIKDTWICATQNRIGIVRHGASSEEIGSQLSKVEKPWWKGVWIRNFDNETSTPGTGRIQSGAVMKSREELSGVEGGKGICYQWKEKVQCLQGDRCSFRHETQDRPWKPEHTPATPSELYHEVEVCRGREVSEAKVTTGLFFDNRADIIWKVLVRERLVNVGILPSVNPIKPKRVAKPVIRLCFRIARLMNNQKRAEKKLHPKKKRKTTTRKLWLLSKLYHNWVVYHKIQTHSFLKVESLGETRCRKSWNQFKGYDALSLRYFKQVSREKKDHRLEKYMSKILISEVPTQWNLRTGPMKRLNDNSDAPEARHGTLPKSYTSSKRKTKLHSARPRRNGYSRLRQQKSQRKESLWWIPERVCIWSASERPQLCWVGDHEDIKKSDDGDDGQRRGANQRRSHGIW